MGRGVVDVINSQESDRRDDLWKRFGGPKDFYASDRSCRTRSADIPDSAKTFLDPLSQCRNVGSQVVHPLCAQHSLELDELSVYIFQLLFGTVPSTHEIGYRFVLSAYELKRS